jgi:hypothetical protein
VFFTTGLSSRGFFMSFFFLDLGVSSIVSGLGVSSLFFILPV